MNPLKIKIYSDGAEKRALLEMNQNPLVQGMTTNPSLMKKAGVRHYKEFCLEVLKEIKVKPISFEVFADDAASMLKQAREIREWGSNVYVKIPIQNTQGKSCSEVIRELSQEKTKLNVTAIFTVPQVIEACRALEGGAPSIVSVFAGRIADTGRDPLPILSAASEICKSYGSQIELLWASTRELFNVIQAEQMGCQIITMPFDLISKLGSFGKSLEAMSLETVQTFKKDSDSSGFSLN